MNMNSIKKQVRLALENSMSANRFSNLVESRRKSMIDSVAQRVKSEGITVEAATAFANHPATFQLDLDSRRIEDYGQIKMRHKQLVSHWKRQRMARVGKTHTCVIDPNYKRASDDPSKQIEFN